MGRGEQGTISSMSSLTFFVLRKKDHMVEALQNWLGTQKPTILGFVAFISSVPHKHEDLQSYLSHCCLGL